MIPHTDQALRMLSQRLMVQLVPDMKSIYSISDGALVGLLMNALADELAEGIQRRLDDLAEMRQILAEVMEALTPEEEELLETEPVSMRLADVDEHHDRLTRVIIRLHALSEEKSDLSSLNVAIWAYLRRHAARHAITAVP